MQDLFREMTISLDSSAFNIFAFWCFILIYLHRYFCHCTSCSHEWKSIMMSSEWYARTHTTEKYTFSSWTHQMFCFSATLYSRDFVDMFLIRMLGFLLSVFSENCKIRLGCSIKKSSFPGLVEVTWSPRPKSRITLLFSSHLLLQSSRNLSHLAWCWSASM